MRHVSFPELLRREVVRRLVPSVSVNELDDVIGEIRRELLRPDVQRCETWQEAWAVMTNQTGGRYGSFAYTPSRCAHCNGRRYTHRNPGHNLAMTGSPMICGDCRGTGRARRTTVPARPAPTDG